MQKIITMQKNKMFNQLLSKRDYSGSPEDEYAQNIETFHHHSVLQGKEGDFFALINKSIKENKRITLNPSFEKENPDYDEIPFEELILV